MADGSPGARSNRAPLSIIIPAYNEEAILASNIERLRTYLKERDISAYEIILASNGSTDRTVEIARAYARAHDDLPYFRKAQRAGCPLEYRRPLEPITSRSSSIARRTGRKRRRHSNA